MDTIILTLVMSICTIETGMTNKVNRFDGGSPSWGYCQVKITTAKRFDSKVTVKKLMNRDYNMKIAQMYLTHQLERYNGDVKKAVSAYNHGSYSTKNTKYVDKVIDNYISYGLVFNHIK